MRIGIVASEFPPNRGGMEAHAGSVAYWLDRHDDEVTVVTRDALGIDLGRGRTVHGLSGNLSRDAALLASQQVDCWLAMSAPLVALAALTETPMFGYVHGLDGIRPWMPHQPTLERAARIAARAGVSLDAAVHRWRRYRIGLGMRRLRGLFSNSRYTADLFSTRYRLARDTITVVHPGVNEDFLDVVRESGGPILRLVLIARLQSYARRKNVDGVLRAVALISGDVSVALHIVGTGDDLDNLRRLATDLGIGDLVTFEGAASHERVKALFAKADAFVLTVKPSDNDIEGFGMVYAEAACAGLPSIAVDVGGVSEAVQDGTTGILIADASPSSIAAGIRLFRDQRARARFDPQAIREFGRERTARRTTEQLRAHIAARMLP